ncbi:nitroreductase family deazaflavin-dependent oxidoreductase [Kibdelosporangium aridum]|uniref:nitroreductase family deazaflavin-dependent oxidoreductase n=1 Tax=Kibdelosporangium aridum TaxID=2030 RepID=UPI000525EF55
MDNPNEAVIAEFRANSGVVVEAAGGAVKDLDLVILHHVGRKSGKTYQTPVSYMDHEGSYLLVASYAGASTEPQWVANVAAMPALTVEFGTGTMSVTATVLREGAERDRLYAAAVAQWPFLRDYEARTDRRFPMVRLDPVTVAAD